MNNVEIRQEIKRRRLYHWEIAAEIGVSAFTFSVWLRTELSPDRKQKILAAIENLSRKVDA